MSDNNSEASEDEEPAQQTLTGKPTTELVNQKRTDDFDVDIGRADYGNSNINNTPTGEPGWLGNPYSKDDYGREGCIERFREDFVERLQTDSEFRSAVENLQGKTLACWCKPKACHGDVILEFLEDGQAFIERYRE